MKTKSTLKKIQKDWMKVGACAALTLSYFSTISAFAAHGGGGIHGGGGGVAHGGGGVAHGGGGVAHGGGGVAHGGGGGGHGGGEGGVAHGGGGGHGGGEGGVAHGGGGGHGGGEGGVAHGGGHGGGEHPGPVDGGGPRPGPGGGGVHHGGGFSHAPPVEHNNPDSVVHRGSRQTEKFKDGTVRYSRPGSNTKIEVDRSGRRTEFHADGRITQTHGAKVIVHSPGGEVKVTVGKEIVYKQTIREVGGVKIINRNYHVTSRFLGAPVLVERSYFPVIHHSMWSSPLYFGNPSLSFVAGLSWGYFLGETSIAGYSCPWGYSYWTDPYVVGTPWYRFYGDVYWRPYGWWGVPTYYPYMGLLDFIMADTLSVAFDDLRDRIEQRVRTRLEEAIYAAESDEEAASLQASLDIRVDEETRREFEEVKLRMRAEHDDHAISRGSHEQFANQVKQITEERRRGVKIDDAFASLLNNPGYMFVVSDSPEEGFARKDGTSCQVHVGDVLKLQSYTPGIGASLEVVTSNPDSCEAGLEVLVPVENLLTWYNDFQQRFDMGGQKLINDAGRYVAPPAPPVKPPLVPVSPPIVEPGPVVEDPLPSASCSCSGSGGCCTIM